jgi:ATP synthase protein I
MPDERKGDGPVRGDLSPADKAEFQRRVKDLDKKLGDVRSSATGRENAEEENGFSRRGMAYGLRMGSELVAAVLVGGLIGYFLDQWLGTTPWLFLLFFVLGFAAGVLNVMRSFKRLQEEIRQHTRGNIGHSVPDDDD